MASLFALSGMANRFLAWLAHSGEVLFDTHQDATSARLDSRTVLVDIRCARFTHRRNPRERRLARLTEIIEMCLNAFSKRACF
jgi:hypothetical protein